MSDKNEANPTWRTTAATGRSVKQKWRSGRTGPGKSGRGIPLRVQKAIVALGLFGLMGGIGWLVILPIFTAVPKCCIVSVGVSVYANPSLPPNPFGRQDAEAFRSLHDANPEQFPEGRVVVWDNRLSKDLLDAIGSDLGSLQDQNLIVFCSLHGMVRAEDGGTAAYFYAFDADPDSPHTGDARHMVPVRPFLQQLAKTPAENVLLLLDTARLQADWRMGILSNDFLAQLREEIEQLQAEAPRLHVLYAAGPHESSWTSNQWNDGQSSFVHFAIDGLKRAADGWQLAGPNQQFADHKSEREDGRVSFNELHAYVTHHVGEWSRQHRGVAQTVVRLPQTDADFNLVQIRTAPSQPDEPDDVAAAAPRDAADSETPSDPEADAKPAAEAPAAEAPVANASNASNSPTDTPNPPEGQSKPQTVAARGTTDGAETPATAPNGQADSTTVGKPSPLVELAVLRRQLSQHWQKRDELAKDGSVALYAPRQWRSLQSQLHRTQQLILCQAAGEARAALDQIALLIEQLDVARTLPISSDAKTELGMLSLALADSMSSVAIDKAQLAGIEAALKQFGEAPGEAAEQFAALQKLVGDKPELESVLAKHLWSELLQIDVAGRDSVLKSSRLLTLIPEGRRPVELLHYDRLVDLARKSVEGRIDWTPEFAELVQTCVRLHDRMEHLRAASPEMILYVRVPLANAAESVLAGERWLAVGNDGIADAKTWLERSDTQLNAVDEYHRLALEACQLQARLIAEIPDFARWIAKRAESDPGRGLNLQRLTVLAEFYTRQESSPPPSTDRQSRQIPSQVLRSLAESQEQQLLTLIADTQRLNDLLTSASQLRTLAGTDNADQLRYAIQELQRGHAGFRKSFDDRVDAALVSADWVELHAALQVPWLDNSKRESVLSALAGRQSTGFRSQSANGDAAESISGIWQGFWAIQVLSLSGDQLGNRSLSELWKQWAEVVTAGEESSQSQRRLIASLGGAINEWWWEISRNAYARLPRDTSPEEFETALTTHVRLIRTMDGMDPQPDDEVDPVVEWRKRRAIDQFLADRRQQFLQQSTSYDRMPTDVAFADRCRQIARLIDPTATLAGHSDALPALADLPDVLTFPLGSDQRISLPITLNPGNASSQADLRHFELRFMAPVGASVLENGAAAERVSVSLGGDPFARVFDITLAESFGVDPQPLTVAVLDADRDGFPVEIRRIQLKPPLDPREWSVVFLTPSEYTTRILVDRIPRNVPRTDGIELFLPPAAPESAIRFGLGAYLVRPKLDSTESVTVELFLNDPTGKPRLLSKVTDVLLAESGQPTFLPFDLEAANSTPMANAATPPQPPPATAIDVSRGLIARITPQNRQTIEQAIHVNLYSADQLIEILDPPTFDNFRFSIRLQRLAASDPLLPVAIPVELKLDTELQSLPALGQDLNEPALGYNRPRELSRTFAEFDPLQMIDREFEIALSVGGLPHAFRWDIQYQRIAQRDSGRIASVRFAEPRNGQVFKQGDPVQLRVEVDSTLLDQGGDRDPWRLEIEIVPSGVRPGDGQKDSWNLVSTIKKTVNIVALKQGQWLFQTSASDYEKLFPTGGRSGRFTVFSRLFPPGQTTAAAETSIAIAVDSNPPATPVFIDPPQSFLVDGTQLRLNVRVNDPESGIRELRAGIDLNSNGMLDKNEELPQIRFDDWLSTDQRVVPLRFPVGLLPEVEGKFAVLTLSTNGAGVANELPAAQLIEFRLPVKTGSLAVHLKNKSPLRNPKIQLIGQDPENRNFLRDLPSQSEINVAELPIGKYKVEVTMKGKTKEEEFVIPQNRQVEVTFDLAQF